MVAEKYILMCQIAASAFMGLDYFLTEEQRANFNQFLKKHLHPLQQREYQFLAATYQKVLQSRKIIAMELSMLVVSITTILYLVPYLETRVHILITLLIVLVSFLVLLSSTDKLLAVVFYNGVPVAFSIFKVGVTRFLIRCPKGTGFGVGFLFLVLSFICRGVNIDW